MNVINKTCCFTGHRNISKKEFGTIEENLNRIIYTLIDYGFIYFLVGGALGFDTLVALTLLQIRKYCPWIKLILVLPCFNQDKYWSNENKSIYQFIKNNCNKYLINNSNLCISYLQSNKGGTSFTVSYAKRKHINVINIAKLK